MAGSEAGILAWVNLSDGRFGHTHLTAGLRRKFLGGKAMGAYLLNRLLPSGTDPLSADNMLIITTGPLTGTPYPAAARVGLITRSPLTGTFLDSYAGGEFGPRMRWTGYDALIISGRAERPVYLVLEAQGLRIEDAAALWGLTSNEAGRRLKEVEGRDGVPVSVAAIGPAGEAMSPLAAIICERRAFGRGGAGAVLGAKRLKAVLVRGRGRAAVSDPRGFRAAARRARRKIAASPITGTEGSFRRVGTLITVDVTEESGTLPSFNWRENRCGFADRINSRAFEHYIRRTLACFACPIACSRQSRASWAGREYETVGPEYETVYAFGANIGIRDPAAVVAANRLCEDYGLDTISTGVAIGLAAECFQKGIIDSSHTGGMNLGFGRADTLLTLIAQIGRRRGFGALLSGGVKDFVRHFPDAEPFAMEVKGLELPGYDPRGMKGQALTYAVADRGGCHLRSSTLGAELLGRPPGHDRFSYSHKADLIWRLQAEKAVFNSLIECLFAGFALDLVDLAEATSAATGFDLQAADLIEIGQRAWHLTRCFNVLNGFRPADDTLPPRLFEDASNSGPAKGEVVARSAFERMKADYYQLVGWDTLSGMPFPETLAQLSLAQPSVPRHCADLGLKLEALLRAEDDGL